MLFNKNHNVKENPRNKVAKGNVTNRNVVVEVPGIILAKVHRVESRGAGRTNKKFVADVFSKGVKSGGESFRRTEDIAGPMTQQLDDLEGHANVKEETKNNQRS